MIMVRVLLQLHFFLFSQVKAFSQTDTSWVIQGESGFSARYLAPLQSVPGTMWEMGADIQRQKVGWFEVSNSGPFAHPFIYYTEATVHNFFVSRYSQYSRWPHYLF